ncbi:hypothetical protein D3C76_753350 [compost metagenome]
MLINDNVSLTAMNEHDLTALMPMVIAFVIVVGIYFVIPNQGLMFFESNWFEQLLHSPSMMTKYKHFFISHYNFIRNESDTINSLIYENSQEEAVTL